MFMHTEWYYACTTDIPTTDDDANDNEDASAASDGMYRICIACDDSAECDESCEWNGCVATIDCDSPAAAATSSSTDIVTVPSWQAFLRAMLKWKTTRKS